MQIKEIKELIRTVNESDIAEFIYESEGTKVTIRKKAAFTPVVGEYIPASAQTAPSTAAGATAPEAQKPTVAPANEFENTITIVAPMVGTFYRAPSPDAAPYVNVDDEIDVGQPLCIIEAMKLMNEIESEVKGRIVRILAENAQPVEYGQPLFVVELA